MKMHLRLSAVLLLTAILGLSLASCMVVSKHYKIMEPAENVKTVEILYCENDGSGGHYGDSLKEGDEFVVCTVDPSEVGDMMAALADLPFQLMIPLMGAVDPNFCYDGEYTLRVTYESGGVELISAGSVQDQMPAEGRSTCSHCFLGDEEWTAFLRQYAPEALDGE